MAERNLLNNKDVEAHQLVVEFNTNGSAVMYIRLGQQAFRDCVGVSLDSVTNKGDEHVAFGPGFIVESAQLSSYAQWGSDIYIKQSVSSLPFASMGCLGLVKSDGSGNTTLDSTNIYKFWKTPRDVEAFDLRLVSLASFPTAISASFATNTTSIFVKMTFFCVTHRPSF